MIDRKLFVRLILPLIFITLVGIAWIWPPHPTDLINNLIVEILGILITILFVDWVIKNREKEKWEKVDVIVKSDFVAWSLRFILETTVFFENSGVAIPKTSNFKSPDKPWILPLGDISNDQILSAIYDSDLEEREFYATALEKGLDNLMQLFIRYSNRLSPEDIKEILELEGVLRSLIRELLLIDNEADLLNLSGGDSNKVDTIWIKYVERVAINLKEVISLTLKMYGKFGFSKYK
jgi:hypothetical protein